jgi:hypothetical protein
VVRADRLVLLGDVIELRRGARRDALAGARGPLLAITAALPPDAELVFVAGNHDHGLIADALAARDPTVPLGLAAGLPLELGSPVPELGPERLRVAYPGVWLRDDVWATHGHYADRHTTVPMFERIGAGVMARIGREDPDGAVRAEDYEAALAPLYAWIDARAEWGGPGGRRDGASAGAWSALTGSRARRGLRGRALAAGFPLAIAGLNRAGVGPLDTDLSSAALRRGPLSAIGEVTRRLGVSAAHVVFGHTHRAGPLDGDDPAEWRTPSGIRLTNTGCWTRETTFLGRDPARSPYRAGFAVWVEDEPGRPPELVNLLD